ncbi:MAG: PEP-CTERM sorting domain-containing protein [Pseudomonadota bacterium]
MSERIYRRSSSSAFVFAFVALAMLSTYAETSRANLISANSAATLFPNGTLAAWNVNSGPDNVFLANFFFRSDTVTSANGGEVNLSGLGAVTETQLGPDAVRFESSNGELAALQTWSLTGGAPGTEDSFIESEFTIANQSGRSIPLSLYFAADFDIAFDQANPNDETTALNGSAVEVFDPVTRARILSQVTPTADSYQVFDGLFEVLFNFNADIDGPTSLGNTPALGSTVFDVPGVTDAGFAFRWTLDLAPGESFTAIASNVRSAVPVPATLGLLALGLAGLARVSRRYQQPAA